MLKYKRVSALIISFILIVPQTVFSKAVNIDTINSSYIKRGRYVQNEVIIKYRSNINTATSKAYINSKYSLKTKRNFKSINAEVVKIPENTNVENIVNVLKNDKDVEMVQPNFIYYPTSISGDERSSELWGLENTGQTIGNQAGISGIDINLKNAWTKTQGNDSEVIAVIDTGIDINHPDLKDRIWVNTKEIPGNGIDDDGNGYIDDINGWDFYNYDNTVYDEKDGDKHGTHVAGIIAASLNNIGVVGVAPKAKIMPLKFIGPFGGTTEDAVLAIDYASNMGVKILNNSWGGSDYDPVLKVAIETSNSLFVAAAGNEYTNIDYSPSYPASFDSPNIITVAAVDNRGILGNFSNYGVKSVDIAAPGINILSTIPKQVDIGAAVQYKGGNYKTFVQGISLSDIYDEVQRQSLINKILQFFQITQSSRILLVVDDESTVYDATGEGVVFEDALINLGFNNFQEYYVNRGFSGPNVDMLNSYDLVIWATGDAYYSTLTNLDIENLKGYLANNNKNLFLAGNFMSNSLLATDFAQRYLHVKFLYNDDFVKELSGVYGSTFEGQVLKINDNYYDRIEAADEATQTVLNFKGDKDYSNSYEYLHGTSMAAPYISGIAALLLSKGIEDPIVMKDKILLGVRPLNSLNGKVLTGGIADAYSSLKYIEDFNNDRSINISDLAQEARYYNKKISTETEKIYDLNNDGIINIFDLVMLSKDIN